MKLPNDPTLHRAFSLLELLVVIAVLAIMAAAGSMAMGSGSKSLLGASAVASSIFNQARTEAILRKEEVMVLVDNNTANPANYLRRLSIFSTNGGQLAKWVTLPASAYFNPQMSGASTTNITAGLAGGGGTFFCYRFLPNGQTTTGQFVITPGVVNGGAFREKGTNQRYGFKVFRMGKVVFFEDPASITPP